jgi:hypothetical protein
VPNPAEAVASRLSGPMVLDIRVKRPAPIGPLPRTTAAPDDRPPVDAPRRRRREERRPRVGAFAVAARRAGAVFGEGVKRHPALVGENRSDPSSNDPRGRHPAMGDRPCRSRCRGWRDRCCRRRRRRGRRRRGCASSQQQAENKRDPQTHRNLPGICLPLSTTPTLDLASRCIRAATFARKSVAATRGGRAIACSSQDLRRRLVPTRIGE